MTTHPRNSIDAKSSSEALQHLTRYLKQLNARLEVWFGEPGVLTSLTGAAKDEALIRSVDDALSLLDDLKFQLEVRAVIPKLKSLKGAAKQRIKSSSRR